MFPRFFSYAQVPAMNTTVPLSLMNLVPGAATDVVSSSSGMQTQIASMLLNAGLITSQTSPYMLQGPSMMALNSATCHPNFLGVDPSAAASLLPYLACLQQQQVQNSELLAAEAAKNVDAHTIVRAPVLYETAKPKNGDKKEGPSPPDLIVASYAAAARAAAIACQQPLSNAAEVFLSAASVAAGSGSSTGMMAKSKMRKAKASRLQLESTLAYAAAASSALQLSTKPANVSTNSNSSGPLSWNSAWTRIVDRQADVVVYISPGGARLKSLAEIRAHLNVCFSELKAVAISDDCIASSFCFDASRDTRLVRSPDDSIFVFPEQPAILATTSTHAHSHSNNIGIPITSSIPSLTSSTTPSEDVAGGKRMISSDYNCRVSFNSHHSSIQSTEESAIKRVKTQSNSEPPTIDAAQTVSCFNDPPANEISTSLSDVKQNLSLKHVTESPSNDCKENSLEVSSNEIPIDEVKRESMSNNVADFLTTTTSTFVSRGGVEVDGPSVVSSVLPPVPVSSVEAAAVRTTASNNEVLNALTLAAVANRSQQANGLAAYLSAGSLALAQQQQAQQQQMLAASQLNQFARLMQLQQSQPSPVSWPFVSEEGVLQQQLQVSAAMEQFQRQQQLAAILQLQHQQQHAQAAAAQQQQLHLQQQLQAYATALQQVQQLTGADLTQSQQ